MFAATTDYEKVCQKLASVGATLEQRFDNSTEKFEASSQIDIWKVTDRSLIVVSYDDGGCGLYPLVGQELDRLEKDLLLIDLLAKKLDAINDDDIFFSGLLSKDEVFKLQEAVKRDGVIDEVEAERLVNWAITSRVNAECLNLLTEGFLTVDGWKGNEPQFGTPVDEVEFITGLNQENPILKQSEVEKLTV